MRRGARVRADPAPRPSGATDPPPSAVAPKLDPRLYALAGLLDLQARTRWASRQEVRFIAVNELKPLVHFTQAALWEHPPGRPARGRVTALSNTPFVDRAKPIPLLIERLVRMWRTEAPLDAPVVFTAADPGGRDTLRADWRGTLPQNALYQPLKNARGRSFGALILWRGQPFREGERGLVERYANALSHALLSAKPRGASNRPFLPRPLPLVIAAAIAAGLIVPVPNSVLAPAEVIAKAPSLIRAPLEAVVDTIHVSPNQAVSPGDLLVSFDRRALESQRALAESARALAKTELRQARQNALGSTAAIAAVAAAEGRLRTAELNIGFLSEELAKTELRARQAGIAVFQDGFDWAGRPVALGEQILRLADPQETELELFLPAHDRIPFEDGARVRFFSDAAPLEPLRATVRFVSYRATPTDFQTVAFRVKATWATPPDLPLGARGTAKIFGAPQPFILQMLRRPLAQLRQWLAV